MTFHRCFRPSFGSFDQTVSEVKNLKNQPIKQESPVAAMFVNGSRRMNNFNREPSIDVFYQVSDHLAKQFQRRRFLEIDQSETRIVCLLTNRDKMSNLYRGTSIDDYYQVSVNLDKRFQRCAIISSCPCASAVQIFWIIMDITWPLPALEKKSSC
jgi:hypothetical protein